MPLILSQPQNSPKDREFDRNDQFLYDKGVKAIFGPGTNLPNAARDILKLIRQART